MQSREKNNRAADATLSGIALNIFLAIVKMVAGVFGHSYALIADAIESTSDIFTSIVVLVCVRMAGKPADENHPYGHGKFEPLAGAFVALVLLAAAIVIAIESIKEIRTPHHAPAPFTLAVLVGVIVLKELIFRRTQKVGKEINSIAIKSDAWHHRSDAITSAAAFVGITIAIFAGPGYECADDFAALFAAFIISINSLILLKPALFELLDTAPDPQMIERIRSLASTVPGVLGTHKCHIRKLGFDYFVDLDILCDPNESIRFGHTIAHNVGDVVHRELPEITRILVHVEPADDYGRRMIKATS